MLSRSPGSGSSRCAGSKGRNSLKDLKGMSFGGPPSLRLPRPLLEVSASEHECVDLNQWHVLVFALVMEANLSVPQTTVSPEKRTNSFVPSELSCSGWMLGHGSIAKDVWSRGMVIE